MNPAALTPERSFAGRCAAGVRCFAALQSTNIKERLSHPWDIWLEMFLFLLQQLSGLGFLYIVFARLHALGGWGLPEIVFLYAMTLHSMALYRLFFQGVRDTGFLILSGSFDLLLTKPRSPILLLFCRRSNLNGLSDFIAALALQILTAHQMQFDWTFARILQWAAFIVCGNALMVSIMLTQAACCFWLVRFTALHDLVMALREFTYYPLSIYGWPLRVLLYTLVPLGFATYVPAGVLLGRPEFSGVWLLAPFLAAGAALLLSVAVFHLGLRFYRSTGS